MAAQASVAGGRRRHSIGNRASAQRSASPKVSEARPQDAATKVARLLAENKLDEEQIDIDWSDENSLGDDLSGVLEFTPGMSPEEMSDSFNEFLDGYRSMQSSLSSFGRKRVRRVSVREAKRILTEEEAHKLLDMDTLVESAVHRAEHTGVVFHRRDRQDSRSSH